MATNQTQKKAVRVQDLTDPLVGNYEGTREVKGRFGPSKIHTIGGTEVWGTTLLDECLSTMTQGTPVKISFTGKEDTGNGGFRYTVNVDKL